MVDSVQVEGRGEGGDSSSSSSMAAGTTASSGSSYAYQPYQAGSGRYRANGVGGGSNRERSKNGGNYHQYQNGGANGAGGSGRYRDRDKQKGEDHPLSFISGSPMPAASAASSSSSSTTPPSSFSRSIPQSAPSSSSIMDIDLQTPRAFVTIIGLLIFAVGSYKAYQQYNKERIRRKREQESEKAAEELLRLNVKHGVVDRDGTVLRAGGGSGSGAASSATGVNVSMTSGSLVNRKEGKDKSGLSSKHEGGNKDDRRRRTDPLQVDPSTTVSSSTATTTTTDEPDSASRSNKNEAKKAKKKIKRAAKLEQRKDVEDNVLGFEPSEEGADSRAEQDQIEESEAGGLDEVDDGKGLDDEVDVREVEVDQLESSRVEDNEPVEDVAIPPVAALEDKKANPILPPVKPIPSQTESPFIRDMPSIQVQNIALPNSPPYSKIDCVEPLRRPSESLSDSAISLLSGGGGSSSGLSNHLPAISQQLAHHHHNHHQDVSGASTPSDKPASKPKKKAKASVKPQRIVPGAENWVKETHEERQREHHEQLIREAEQAKMAMTTAEARASKAEERNDVLMNRIHKLELKLSKLTMTNKDLTEREKQAIGEKEEAYKRSAEAQGVMQNYRKVETALKHDSIMARKERDKMWQDAQRNEADLRTQLQQMNAQLAQAVHSAASYESALRATGRLSGNPVYGAPLPIMSTPVGLPSHHGHMLLGNPLPNQSRMSLSTPPSPQSIMTPTGSPWAERNMFSGTPSSPSKKRSPPDAYGLPLAHPLSANTTPARESSLARTVLKHKGDATASSPAAASTQTPTTPTAATANQTHTQTTPTGRNRAGTVNDTLIDLKEKENQPPVADGVGSSMSESVSLPSSLKLRDVDQTGDDDAGNEVEAKETIDSPIVGTGDDTDHFFVFPSLHHNPEHVKKAMEEERGRRASLQRSSSGMSQLGSPSVSPGKTHANKISLNADPDDVVISDKSSGSDMTDSHGSTAFSSQNDQDELKIGHEAIAAKQPDLSPVNESTEVMTPVPVL